MSNHLYTTSTADLLATMKDKHATNIYLGGDIFLRGSWLAREEEFNKLNSLGLDANIYSPVRNTDINDKAAVTVEENNCLCERIVPTDVDRMFMADVLVMCPEQHAIGTMTETGVIYGWKYLAQRLLDMSDEAREDTLHRLIDQEVHYHYFDKRMNDLPEINYRRSFGMNAFLYGCVLLSSTDGDFIDFDDICERIKSKHSE